MISKIINRLLNRYESSSYFIQNRARFILYLIFTILIITPILIIYFYYIHLYDPVADYIVIINIVRPILIAFIISCILLLILFRGHFSLAGNLLLIVWQSALWGIIFLAKEDSIIRIDTTILIAATLIMMPIIIVKQKKLFIIYTMTNIAVFFIFMLLNKDELHISDIAFNDYLSVNTIAFILVGIFSYTIYSINLKSLEKAESEIAERKKTEEQRNKLQIQLVQSQKLESVGLLAGGVAHDFNNILAVIQGFAELAAENTETGSTLKTEINEIIRASKKARDLTQQLLAFARIQPLDLKNININDIIRDFTVMLSRTLRENIAIRNELCDNPGSIEGDPIQVEQVILNLALNAQDAMPEGGTILIRTSRVEIAEDFIKKYGGITPGYYILLSISDSGSGIDPGIKDKIFDPFFTTKDFGKGTGLGLSTVYGIVKQHGGIIQFHSDKKSGTVFNIYLPVKDTSAEADTPRPEGLVYTKGNETILAVEDNPEVRNLLETILKKTGYTAFIAENADEALTIATSYDGIIHLLITDVIIPGMNGMQLYGQIMRLRPEIKVIYISGYTASAIDWSGTIEEINFIQKPFSIADFYSKVRYVLDT